MKQIKYWLVGAIFGGVLGAPLILLMMSGECRESWCIFPSMLNKISWTLIGSILPTSDTVEMIGILIPYIVIGGIVGWIYGKIKGTNQ